MCALGVYLCICLQGVYSGSFPEQLSERCVLWVFPLKMCTLGVSLHTSFKDVYSQSFLAHLSSRYLLWVFPCTSMWKICGLGIFTEYLSLRLCMLATLLHICLKHMHPDHVHTHLCEAYVYLDIWPCSHTSMWSLCLLRYLTMFTHIYVKPMSTIYVK